MVALFAVGVITGTVLSFEMGLLWPNFTGTFGGGRPSIAATVRGSSQADAGIENRLRAARNARR
jgi:hypothetical protein